jgi:hypothetical protein
MGGVVQVEQVGAGERLSAEPDTWRGKHFRHRKRDAPEIADIWAIDDSAICPAPAPRSSAREVASGPADAAPAL